MNQEEKLNRIDREGSKNEIEGDKMIGARQCGEDNNECEVEEIDNNNDSETKEKD